ncbi:hypothetical protein CTAYLR_002005 [Chrysophaeum taylorii]|uniref:CAP-Gly domain-containing protein n=1 Tax=Chrysophaeum taylorii TaxID=2483200 RepID=A0AAD7XLB4_9STRA|nr:hypothetical protein CTAYLR_002005 [Chrysophaeum taylorii]
MGIGKDEACELLGVPACAPPEAIKKAYKRAALATHPDKNPDPQAKAKFQRVAEAYKCLTDPNYVAETTGISEEELRREMEEVYEEMYAQFKSMCAATGIPAPPPELARAMMLDGMLDSFDDDVSPELAGQMRNVMRDMADDCDLDGLPDDVLEALAATHLDDLDDLARAALCPGFYVEDPPKPPRRPRYTTNKRSPGTKNRDTNAAVVVGAKVRVRGATGTVKFVGPVHYAKGDWVGVALDLPDGKNNGTIKGTTYFSCSPKHGIMVRRQDCSLVR